MGTRGGGGGDMDESRWMMAVTKMRRRGVIRMRQERPHAVAEGGH